MLGISIFDTAVLGMKTIGIINKLSVDILIGAVTTTTSTIYNVAGNIMSYDDVGVENIQESLKEIDLLFKIKVLEELVHEQMGKKHPNSVKVAIDGVNEILINISNELKEIKILIEKHNNKWFKKIRSLNCDKHIQIIKKNELLLCKRKDMLVKLLEIYKNNKKQIIKN